MNPDRTPNDLPWDQFFAEKCELRDEAFGVRHYGVVNCNYIVFPSGEFLENYGFQAGAVMDDVRRRGATSVLAEIKEDIKISGELTRNIGNALNGMTETLSGIREYDES